MLVGRSQKVQPIRQRQVFTLDEEPPNLRGLLFMQNQDASVEVLRYSGESDPDTPPDIPEEAVTKQGLYISVDGIGQDWDKHRAQIRDWFHGGEDYGVSLPGPVVGIHEGEGKNTLHDGVRILKNTMYLKALQSGRCSSRSVREKAYKNDPSVKTIYDQLQQSLRVGRQVTFMAHSGGASQVALALALAVEDGGAQAQAAVADKVRFLGTAPAGHRKDLEWSGVKPENIMITGSKRDPVFRFFRNHLDHARPLTFLKFLFDGAGAAARFLLQPGPYHQGEYIFGLHKTDEGHNIEKFLDGGAGNDFPLP